MPNAIEITAGCLLLLQYGNGTQVARVVAVSPRGVVTVRRGLPVKAGHFGPDGKVPDRFVTTFGWYPRLSKLRVNDPRIIGALPETDPRRSLPGFTE